MNEIRSIPWTRIAVEAIAIVGSILLAFAIDAWWAERKDRLAEREILSRLHAEFTSNRTRLDDRLMKDGWMSQARSSSLSIGEVLQTAIEDDVDIVSVSDGEIAALLRTATFEAETPVYESLVRSGRFEIIKNREIVTAMASWDRQLQNAFEIEQSKRRFVSDQFIPALASRSNIQHILMNRFAPTQVAPINPGNMTEISVDHLIVNLVGERYLWATVNIHAIAQVRNSADGVLSELSKYLEQ